MNLAEIRKKAGEARKQEVAETSAQSEGQDAESAAADHDTYASPDEECLPDVTAAASTSEDFSSFALDEAEFEVLRSSGESESEEPPAGDEWGAMPAEPVIDLTQDILPPVVEHAVPAEKVVPAAPVRHPAYDPVATLLAGRVAATGEEISPVDEELVHVSGDMEEYLCFKVADEEYALNIMDIKEIIKPRDVTEVPRMPKFVPGVISLRGVIIPIIDIRLRLSLPVGEPTGRERILVLMTSVGYCGVLVDEVIQVVRLKQGDIEGPPAILDGIDREFVMGLGRFEQRMLILLNLDSILNLEIH